VEKAGEQQEGAPASEAAAAVEGLVAVPVSLAERLGRLQAAQQEWRERVLKVRGVPRWTLWWVGPHLVQRVRHIMVGEASLRVFVCTGVGEGEAGGLRFAGCSVPPFDSSRFSFLVVWASCHSPNGCRPRTRNGRERVGRRVEWVGGWLAGGWASG
jgi:hypothetical protein